MDVAALLARLERVDFDVGDAVPDQSDLEGIKRYMDNVADLSRSLKRNRPLHVMFSPSAVLGAQQVLDGEVVERMNNLVDRMKYTNEALLTQNALEWTALSERGHEITRGREALFEPIVRALERRVLLALRKGYLFVGGNAFPLQRWPDTYGDWRATAPFDRSE